MLSVLIQAYAGQADGNVGQSHIDLVQNGLVLALDDVAQTRDGAATPIPELIRLFARTYNNKGFRYSIVTAQHPFEISDSTDVEHCSVLDTAMPRYSEAVNGLRIGWAALLDNQECRVIGEVYL